MQNLPSYEVIIIGGGGVGLFLANRLHQLGFHILVIEHNTERSKHSRSIGIHPPSLEFLAQMNLVNPFLERGLHISKGFAIGDHGIIGTLDFKSCPGPYRFILTLPQYITEEILEENLVKSQPESLRKGLELIDFEQKEGEVVLHVKQKNGQLIETSSSMVIGCDGKNSKVRQLLNIPFKGGSYPDTFIMGDFEDTTNFGSNAAIYLQSAGLMESFPLPGNIRRWVVRTPHYIDQPTIKQLVDVVEPRTSFRLKQNTNSMISSFGVQHYIASKMGKGRVGIIGDAAHIVSPFGGQGMNLGWMDAWKLSNILVEQRSKSFNHMPWNPFARRRKMAVWQAIKRAEFNMAMGKTHHYPRLNEFFIQSLLHLPTKWILPRLFTMRWL